MSGRPQPSTKRFRAALAEGTIESLVRDNLLTVRDLAARYGISLKAVYSILRGAGYDLGWRRTERLALLRTRLAGGRTLTEIASELGISPSGVRSMARRAGIQVRKPRLNRNGGRSSHSWSPEMLALLGAHSDAYVAIILGLSRRIVTNKRRELAIPAAGKPGRRHPAPPRLAGSARRP